MLGVRVWDLQDCFKQPGSVADTMHTLMCTPALKHSVKHT